MDQAEAERLIASVGWLAAQASDVRADILARARLIELEKDRHPFHPGDDPGAVQRPRSPLSVRSTR